MSKFDSRIGAWQHPANLTGRGYFRRAMNGVLGKQQGRDDVFGERTFYFVVLLFGNAQKV